MADETPERHRLLTDEDIDAIADVLEARLVQRFYSNLGQGVWGLAKKGAIMALLALAAYGAFTEIGPPK